MPPCFTGAVGPTDGKPQISDKEPNRRELGKPGAQSGDFLASISEQIDCSIDHCRMQWTANLAALIDGTKGLVEMLVASRVVALTRCSASLQNVDSTVVGQLAAKPVENLRRRFQMPPAKQLVGQRKCSRDS
jgi:hypothetical protein